MKDRFLACIVSLTSHCEPGLTAVVTHHALSSSLKPLDTIFNVPSFTTIKHLASHAGSLHSSFTCRENPGCVKTDINSVSFFHPYFYLLLKSYFEPPPPQTNHICLRIRQGTTGTHSNITVFHPWLHRSVLTGCTGKVNCTILNTQYFNAPFVHSVATQYVGWD